MSPSELSRHNEKTYPSIINFVKIFEYDIVTIHWLLHLPHSHIHNHHHFSWEQCAEVWGSWAPCFRSRTRWYSRRGVGECDDIDEANTAIVLCWDLQTRGPSPGTARGNTGCDVNTASCNIGCQGVTHEIHILYHNIMFWGYITYVIRYQPEKWGQIQLKTTKAFMLDNGFGSWAEFWAVLKHKM